MTDKRIALLGAIFGDIIGSPYEFNSTKSTKFPLVTPNSKVTDDSLMTVAVADWLMHGDYLSKVMQTWGRKYPKVGFGTLFLKWLYTNPPLPYQSFGNGSAMRVSPVGWFAKTLPETLELARKSASVSHDHIEGIKGAQSVASAIFLARTGHSKEFIKEYIEVSFGYDLSRSYEEIHKNAYFDATCQVSVPEAIICFLESTDYESAVRLAVALGADADTQACIAGSIAVAYYKEIPDSIASKCIDLIPEDMYKIVEEFQNYISEI